MIDNPARLIRVDAGALVTRCYNSRMDDREPTDVDAPDVRPETGEARTNEIDELKRQLAEQQDRMMRTLAEADNVRRRTERSAEDRVRYANESLLRDLIPVLDNFDRALAAAETAGAGAGVLQGIELIQRELLRVLERAGVTRYSAIGQPFDPNRHEAVSRVVSETAEPNTVVFETAPGYMLNGRVLRAAMVAVAAAPDEDAA